MKRHLRERRTVGRARVVKGTGVAAAAVLVGLVLAGPALAAAAPINVTNSSSGANLNGSTVTSDVTLDASVTESSPGIYDLTLRAPDGSSYTLDKGRVGPLSGPQTLSGQFDSEQSYFDGGGEASNGKYVFQVNGGDSTDVTLAIPPQAVRGFSVTWSGGSVSASWTANTEPDLTGYTITTPSGKHVEISPSEAGCAGSTGCETSFLASEKSDPQTLTYAITAQRCASPGASCRTLSSATSTASANVPASPSPSSSPTPGHHTSPSTGSPSGSKSGSTNPSSGSVPTSAPPSSSSQGTGIGHNGFTKSGQVQAFVPSSHAKIPSVSQSAGPGNLATSTLPGAEGRGSRTIPQGTYRSTLAYPSGGAPTEPGPKAASDNSITSSVHSIVDGSALWRSLGVAAVLLLAGGHLLAWLRRTPMDQDL